MIDTPIKDRGIQSIEAITFMRVKRDLGLTNTQLAYLLDTYTAKLMRIQKGYSLPSDALKKKIRNLAFYNQLPYSASVFPEVDDPFAQMCPMCRNLQEQHRREWYERGETER
jgi:hypothetical protein